MYDCGSEGKAYDWHSGGKYSNPERGRSIVIELSVVYHTPSGQML